MELKHFFTRQRYIILASGILFFAVFITLATFLGHDSELGILFIDLAGSAVTIITTALVIEYFQYREQADRTHQVATIAEEEIQAICFRVKLAVVKLYGFRKNDQAKDELGSLDDVEAYLQTTSRAIDDFHAAGAFQDPGVIELTGFIKDTVRLQAEIESALNLFGYALPFSLRASVLSQRSRLQIADRSISYVCESGVVNDRNAKLIPELTSSIFRATDNVLRHESRTDKNQSIARKPSRVGKKEL